MLMLRLVILIMILIMLVLSEGGDKNEVGEV